MSQENPNLVELPNKSSPNQDIKENVTSTPDDINIAVFCAGNQDMINLVAYINNKLRL